MKPHAQNKDSHIVADGQERLMRTEEVQARLRQLRETIAARYAPQLVMAGPLRLWVLRWRMFLDYRRERKQILPSPGSLFANGR